MPLKIHIIALIIMLHSNKLWACLVLISLGFGGMLAQMRIIGFSRMLMVLSMELHEMMMLVHTG